MIDAFFWYTGLVFWILVAGDRLLARWEVASVVSAYFQAGGLALRGAS